VVRNILPSGFFAGQDIPAFHDGSLLFIFFQRENTGLALSRVIIFPVVELAGRVLLSMRREKNWAADTMQHVQACGHRVRRLNSSPAM